MAKGPESAALETEPHEVPPHGVAHEFLSTGEIAEICEVAPRTVAKWFDRGKLRGFRHGPGGARRVSRPDLERFLRENLGWSQERIQERCGSCRREGGAEEQDPLEPGAKFRTFLTIGQAAKICEVAPGTVVKLFDRGKLKGFRIHGTDGDRRIPADELRRFLRENFQWSEALIAERLGSRPAEPSPVQQHDSVLLWGNATLGGLLERELSTQGLQGQIHLAVVQSGLAAGVRLGRGRIAVLLLDQQGLGDSSPLDPAKLIEVARHDGEILPETKTALVLSRGGFPPENAVMFDAVVQRVPQEIVDTIRRFLDNPKEAEYRSIGISE